jgi:F-type H+-transporting ATPase subunit delta
MSATRIATRYAKSLLDLAISQGKLEQVHTDMQYLSAAVKNRDLYLLLKNPVIPNDKKNTILGVLFKDKVSDLASTYMKLLVQKNREMYLPEIAAEFEAQYSNLRKISSVRVTTAAPLNDQSLADLQKQLLASGALMENVNIEAKVDPDLIGGFVLEFDNKRYDASVSHKLEQLKAEFSKNLYVKEF